MTRTDLVRRSLFALLLSGCMAELDTEPEVGRVQQAATIGAGTVVTTQPPGSSRWGRVAGDLGWDTAYGAIADGTGWIVTGTFQGTVNFGCGPMTARGNSDMFLVRYASTGSCSWARQVGGSGDTVAGAIARGEGGSLLVTGNLSGTADFAAGPLTAAGPYDGFVARFSSTGVNQWRRLMTSTGDVYPNGIAADAQGNAVITGSFAGTASFGGAELTAPGDGDLFVARYSPAGAHQWSQRFGGPGYDVGADVAIDTAGRIIVAGSFEGTASFGGAELTSAGSYDIVVARLTAAGAPISSSRYGSAGDDGATAITADGSGGFALAGYFQQQLALGGVVSLQSQASYAAFTARFGSTASPTWARAAGRAGAWLFAEGARFDAAGNLYVTGSLTGSATFGSTTLASRGDSDLFVVQYTSTGSARWAKAFGGSGAAGGLAVAPATSGVLVTGYCGALIDLGLGALTGRGGYDVPVVALNP